MKNYSATSPAPTGSTLRGFTAVEISAVVTIIAILALILIPILRSRIDESKQVAAKDDMQSIEKSQLIAYGYSSQYFRLQDLPRGESEPPECTWNRPLTYAQVAMIKNTWKGPYYSIHRSEKVANLILNMPELFRSDLFPGPEGGPMLILANEDGDRDHPIDPWGSPYIFFGPGQIGEAGGTHVPLDTVAESDFSTAVVYSMGPDGVPGDTGDLTLEPKSFFRETGFLGTGDDLKREF